MLVALFMVSAPATVHAAVVITANSSSTTYGYGFLGTPFIKVGQALSVRSGNGIVGQPAEYGLDFNTSSSNDTFSFLQNQYCVGKCTTYALTTLTLTLTNTGGSDPMRFDSQITPGHLARQGINADMSAIFDFSVVQKTGNKTHTLYSANGVADSAQTEITTSDGVAFNGLTRSSNGDEWNVLDWSATNINLLLDPIPVGQSATLTYVSLTRTTTTAAACSDLTDCPGVQVVFGDPRNNGGGAGRVASSDVQRAPQLSPVIGLLYDAATAPVDIVEASAPLPPEPEILPPRTYGAPFVSQVPGTVPEPQSWMLMIVAFGFVGAALRRRAGQTPLRAGLA